MMRNTMKIHKHPFGLRKPDYSLARAGNLYGLWDNDTQELAIPCEYEYLRAIHEDYIVFQKDGRRGLIHYDGRILFENRYDGIGFVEQCSPASLFVWYKEHGLYHIATLQGETVMRNLPHWQAAYPDASKTQVKRYAWSNFCVWSTDYSRCRLPLNLLIEALEYPLAFGSLDETYTFGRDASRSGALSNGVSSQEILDWIIAGWYHIARRLEELAVRFGFVYNVFALMPVDTLGCCYHKEKAIVLYPGLLRQPPVVVDGILIHELCHLKYPHHGNGFWQLNQDIARQLGYETYFGHDFSDRYLLDYGHPFPQEINVCEVINKILGRLYDMLAAGRHKCLPLQKLPL